MWININQEGLFVLKTLNSEFDLAYLLLLLTPHCSVDGLGGGGVGWTGPGVETWPEFWSAQQREKSNPTNPQGALMAANMYGRADWTPNLKIWFKTSPHCLNIYILLGVVCTWWVQIL